MRTVILIGGSLDGRKVEVDYMACAYLSPSMENYLEEDENCFEFEGILTKSEGGFVVIPPKPLLSL